MSFSYDAEALNEKLNECRFILGDTNEKSPIMQDEEIKYIIDNYGNSEASLRYHLFIQAATIFARSIRRSLGPQSEDPTSRLDFFKSQAEEYKRKMSTSGLSIPNYSYPKVFSKGMQNNPPWRRRR